MPNGNVRLPSLDLLLGFEAAARLLSFTRAGEELHLTQSAVSRQMQELEASSRLVDANLSCLPSAPPPDRTAAPRR